MVNLTIMNNLVVTVMTLVMIFQAIVIIITLVRTRSKETRILLSLLMGQGIVLTYLLGQVSIYVLHSK